MNHIQVTSTNVGFIAYDASTSELHLAFNNNIPNHPWNKCRKYKYADVPAQVFEDLKCAESKGAFVCREIAFNYKYEEY